MAPKTVKNARYVSFYFPEGDREEPFLYAELDGQYVVIHDEQRHMKYCVVVFISDPALPETGSDLRYKAILPATDWRPATEIRAATSDRRVYRLAQRYLHDVRTGRWEPGKHLEVE